MALDRGQKMPRLDPADNPPPVLTTSHPPVPPDLPFIHVIKLVSLILFIFFGAVTNYIIVHTIVKHRKYHRAPYFHMVSLSIADMGRCVLTFPLSLTSVVNHSWIFSKPACKLSALTNLTFSYAALFSVVAMAVDRHISVVHNRYYERHLKEHRFFLSALIIWGSALIMAFPPLFHFGNYTFDPSECQCTLEFKYMTNNDTLSFLLVIFLALGGTGVVYSRIYVFMRAHRRMRPISYTPAASNDWTFFGPGATGQAVTNWVQGFGVGPPNPAVVGLRNQQFMNRFQHFRSCKNEHLTRMFVIATFVYSILWLPYLVMSVWRLFCVQGDLSRQLVTLSAWLTYVQTIFVPLVYIVSNRSFRRAVRTKETLYIQGETGAVLTPES